VNPAKDPDSLSPAGAEGVERHDPYSAMRSKNYRLFAVGFVCSSMGLQMLGAALLWDVYVRTNDPLLVGLVGLCRALPVIMLALVAGHFIDTHDRRRLLVMTQTLFALAALALAAASYFQAPLWTLYALTILTAIARSFNGPTRNALLPQLVPQGIFTNAVTWNSGLFQFAAVSGPLVAGRLMAWTGQAWPVYLITSVLCFVLAVASLKLEPITTRPPRPQAMTLVSMLAGMRHLYSEKTILAAISLDLLAVLFGGATALLPIFAKDILGVGAFGYGVLRASPYVGALFMSLYLAYRPIRGKAGPALLWSVVVFGVSTIIFGLSTSFWLSLAVLAVGGAADTVSVVIRHVLVQLRTPEHLRGRVSAVNSVFIECSNELGAFESGLVAKWFGPVVSAVSGGVGTMLVVIGVSAAIPDIRRLDRLEPDKAPNQEPENESDRKV